MAQDGTTWSLDEAWDWAVETARGADRWTSTRESWVPPVEEELVLAARAGPLCRWYPFTSHNHLRFADGPLLFVPGAKECRVLPGSISFDKGGPGGDPVFRVWSGTLMQMPDPVLVETTPDAATAVETLLRLLTPPGR
jgi:hypothetical protein